MAKPKQIADPNFGKLSLVGKSTYFAEVSWNRGIHIRVFIHVDGENHKRCLKRAWDVFTAVRANELEIFRQGIDAVDAHEWSDGFLNSAAETSIEIPPTGKGQLVYLLFMVGSLIVQFSRDAVFMEASVMPG